MIKSDKHIPPATSHSGRTRLASSSYPFFLTSIIALGVILTLLYFTPFPIENLYTRSMMVTVERLSADLFSWRQDLNSSKTLFPWDDDLLRLSAPYLPAFAASGLRISGIHLHEAVYFVFSLSAIATIISAVSLWFANHRLQRHTISLATGALVLLSVTALFYHTYLGIFGWTYLLAARARRQHGWRCLAPLSLQELSILILAGLTHPLFLLIVFFTLTLKLFLLRENSAFSKLRRTSCALALIGVALPFAAKQFHHSKHFHESEFWRTLIAPSSTASLPAHHSPSEIFPRLNLRSDNDSVVILPIGIPPEVGTTSNKFLSSRYFASQLDALESLTTSDARVDGTRRAVNTLALSLPTEYREVLQSLRHFPDKESVRTLRRFIGLRYIIYRGGSKRRFSIERFKRRMKRFGSTFHMLGHDNEGNALLEFTPEIPADKEIFFASPEHRRTRFLEFEVRYRSEFTRLDLHSESPPAALEISFGGAASPALIQLQEGHRWHKTRIELPPVKTSEPQQITFLKTDLSRRGRFAVRRLRVKEKWELTDPPDAP